MTCVAPSVAGPSHFLAIPWVCGSTPTLRFGLFLARSVGHVHKRVTDHLNAVYYVADTFSEECQQAPASKMVERNVEDALYCQSSKQLLEGEGSKVSLCVCVRVGVGVGCTKPESLEEEGAAPRDLWAKRLALPCAASHGPAKSHLPPLCFPGALGARGHLGISSSFL